MVLLVEVALVLVVIIKLHEELFAQPLLVAASGCGFQLVARLAVGFVTHLVGLWVEPVVQVAFGVNFGLHVAVADASPQVHRTVLGQHAP